jgi:hypothetical protein
MWIVDSIPLGTDHKCFHFQVIELPDVVVEAFEKLMAYVYKGEVEFSSMDIDLVVGLYYAGL